MENNLAKKSKLSQFDHLADHNRLKNDENYPQKQKTATEMFYKHRKRLVNYRAFITLQLIKG